MDNNPNQRMNKLWKWKAGKTDDNSISEGVISCSTEENYEITVRFQTITPSKNCTKDKSGCTMVESKLKKIKENMAIKTSALHRLLRVD
jgi:hypothetical protein